MHNTSIIGPYDQFITAEKSRVQFGIPDPLFKTWFGNLLPARGSADKVCARLFHSLETLINTHHPNIHKLPLYERETLINNALNHIATSSFNTYDPDSHLPIA
jgi:hypothetical protein